MIKKSITLLIFSLIFCSGCTAARWDIKQLETTFMNEATRSEFVQKNAILLDKRTGRSWVFESDGDSNYYWQLLPEKTVK